MNKKQLMVTWVMILALMPVFVLAQEDHSIDKALTECMDKSQSITAEMRKCLNGATAKWEAEIDKHYNLLMGILDDKSKERLNKSQSNWEKFRDSEFKFIPFYFTDPGSYQGPAIAGHKLDIAQTRALQLQAYYEQVKEGRELMDGLNKDE